MSVRSPPAKPGYDTGISSPSTSPFSPPKKSTTSDARAASSASSSGVFAPGCFQFRRTSASRCPSKYSSRTSTALPASSAMVAVRAFARGVVVQSSITRVPPTSSRTPSSAVTLMS
jgi:hypothetical protein